MANIIERLTRDDPKQKHPAPYRDREKFYLDRSIRGVTLGGEGHYVVDASINGHPVQHFVLGQDNEAAGEYVQLLEDSKSTIRVVDTELYDPGRGGVPRRQRDFRNAKMREESLGDYGVKRLGKSDKPEKKEA